MGGIRGGGYPEAKRWRGGGGSASYTLPISFYGPILDCLHDIKGLASAHSDRFSRSCPPPPTVSRDPAITRVQLAPWTIYNGPSSHHGLMDYWITGLMEGNRYPVVGQVVVWPGLETGIRHHYMSGSTARILEGGGGWNFLEINIFMGKMGEINKWRKGMAEGSSIIFYLE